MAGATRLKYSTNSRPRKKWNKNIRRTNVKLAIPVHKKLWKVEEITEVDTFNCALKCSEWRKINSVTRQTIANVQVHWRLLQPLSTTDRTAMRRPCVLCLLARCVESVTERTTTHAPVDNNTPVSPKDILVQLEYTVFLLCKSCQ